MNSSYVQSINFSSNMKEKIGDIHSLFLIASPKILNLYSLSLATDTTNADASRRYTFHNAALCVINYTIQGASLQSNGLPLEFLRMTKFFSVLTNRMDKWFPPLITTYSLGMISPRLVATNSKNFQIALPPKLKIASRYETDFESMIDHFPTAISRIDRQLRYRYVNDRMEDISKIRKDLMLGKTKTELKIFSKEICNALDEKALEAFTTAQEVKYEFSHSDKNGTRYYSVHIQPELSPQIGIKTALEIIEDITSQQSINIAFQKSKEQLQQTLQSEQLLRNQVESAKRGERYAIQIKNDFLATLSHELRTPLNIVLGWIQTLNLSEFEKTPLLNQALSTIEQTVRNQADLLSDIFSISDISSGKLQLKIERVNVVPLINDVIDSMRTLIEGKHIYFQTEFASSEYSIWGDAHYFRQIIWNLLSNAVKFTPPYGYICITVRQKNNQLELSIKDSGEGINAEFIPYVFDLFRQADASSKRRHEGLGIGLSIARNLVEMHNGKIAIESAGDNQGATFIVTFPLDSVNTESKKVFLDAPSRVTTSISTPHKLMGLRILSVDDDANTREMLHLALESAGAEVLSAKSVRDAVKKLIRFKPDILLSDIGMPEEDGYDLLLQVRALPIEKGGATPAIALTGYPHEQIKLASRLMDYQDFMLKPINLNELFSKIVHITSR